MVRFYISPTSVSGRRQVARPNVDHSETMAGKKRYRDKEEAVMPRPLPTRASHKRRCAEQAEDVLAQHFEEVQSRAMAALEMVQATEQHRVQAEQVLEQYKELLSQCQPSSIGRLSRNWVALKSSDFENADDVILVCREMPSAQGQQKEFKRRMRRLNSHLEQLVAEMQYSLVLSKFVAKPHTVQDIRWALREYKKLLTGALLDFFEDIGLSNDDDKPRAGSDTESSGDGGPPH